MSVLSELLKRADDPQAQAIYATDLLAVKQTRDILLTILQALKEVPIPEARHSVRNLYEHFAACDLAIVQGGGTTTLELTALHRPFLYFPLEGHSEQELAVAGRLQRHQAGIRMSYSKTTAWLLAPTTGAGSR